MSFDASPTDTARWNPAKRGATVRPTPPSAPGHSPDDAGPDQGHMSVADEPVSTDPSSPAVTRDAFDPQAINELLRRRIAGFAGGGPTAALEEAGRQLRDHATAHRPADLDAGTADDPPGALTPPVDPLPMLIAADQWALVEAGVRQRARLHEAILRDLCGPRRLLGADGIPLDLLLPHPAARLALAGIGGTRLLRLACDVTRNADGSWTVISDRADAPAGLGLALRTREISTALHPEVLAAVPVAGSEALVTGLRQSLQAAAPPSAGTSPTVAVLAPRAGAGAVDAICLAERLGLPAVHAGQLRAGSRGVTSEEHGTIHVLLRQILASTSDPLEHEPTTEDSVPGLIEAARARSTALCNPPGAAILDSPALLSVLPRLARTVLAEELSVGSAVTYWCGDRAMGSHVIAHLGRLVIRPAQLDRPGSAIRGWELTLDEQADLAARIAARPWAWVGQEPVDAFTTEIVDDGLLAERPAMIRTFAVGGAGDHQVMAGGLGRVAGEEFFTSTRRVTDVWVLRPDAQEAA